MRGRKDAAWMGVSGGRVLFDICVRVFMILMIVNSVIKYTVFSWLYLAAATYFWFQGLSFYTISRLSQTAVVFLGLQYIFLLLNITEQTSPLPIPYGILN